ncbi:FMN-dependent NADH-azoreductase [Alkalicoccus urumqiensis]|uniref:FMN dependent NADH:quinone oxidoreductase n=1 Tax=Alkalicoccus urumqiensis TaxID=1548213 RepID=A0A2P6MK31_ALKUR|nr:NAD(P)H-dependent oxidoreductase [Alkalicoccus urumqiensis]PRO66621.1 FMN-dependent NADH-azoreductase [Alkalicoccus urumqiensis]
MRVLYVTANPKKEEQSYGLRLGGHFLDSLQTSFPEAEVDVLDLFQVPLPLLGEGELAAWERRSEETVTNTWVEQFLSADKVVFVTPLWNMGVPSPVKAYIDQLILPGQTFTFDDTGIRGLLQGREIVHLQSRGGVYSSGKMAAWEHGDSYIRTIFALTGASVESIIVEGTSTYPDEAEDRLEEACLSVDALVHRWKEEVGPGSV